MIMIFLIIQTSLILVGFRIHNLSLPKPVFFLHQLKHKMFHKVAIIPNNINVLSFKVVYTLYII